MICTTIMHKKITGRWIQNHFRFTHTQAKNLTSGQTRIYRKTSPDRAARVRQLRLYFITPWQAKVEQSATLGIRHQNNIAQDRHWRIWRSGTEWHIRQCDDFPETSLPPRWIQFLRNVFNAEAVIEQCYSISSPRVTLRFTLACHGVMK